MLFCYAHTLGTRKRHALHTCGINSASPPSETHQAEMTEFPCVAPAVRSKEGRTQVITPVILLHREHLYSSIPRGMAVAGDDLYCRVRATPLLLH